ncbi:hypothetical protein M902_0971 [Bacteriovorax sp. BAL6_X]|uniref:hypothetical protein n=1 Tax=Bacteriovorax sp. BAL6_X TaxID=1201290 RepID=UPI00038665CD|nr:hypothetical protein [Bacteriovorax sp. BAL6_X]EPZ49490.1 hypothetical protein M902_0971 [Bacteriovorax sp. BAL6_X]
MDKTSVGTSTQVKTYDYEGKVKEYNHEESSTSNIGLYFCVILFLAVFFGVIVVQMN